MRIKSVRAIEMRYPFARYFGEGKVPSNFLTPSSNFRRIKRLGQTSTLVAVEGEDGRVGYGECFGLPSPTPSCALINEVVGPALAGVDMAEPEEPINEIRGYFFALGSSRGAAMEALSGVDIACWDLLAKCAEKPLADLLGGTEAVEVYVSPVPFFETPKETVEKAEAFVAEGFRSIKLKVGRGKEIDLAHIAAVRSALGPDVELMLDVNCGYDRETALSMIDPLAKLSIGWLEEPLVPEDFDGIEELAKEAPFAIAGGENDFTESAFRRLAEIGVRVLQPNISRALGVSGLRRIDKIAADTGAEVALHGVGASIAVAASLHCCAALPHHTLLERNKLLNPLRDGTGVDFSLNDTDVIMPPEGPGHGGTPDIEITGDILDDEVRDFLRR